MDEEVVIFEELLMSQVVQTEALTRLLVENGVFTQEQFLEKVKVVYQEMKRNNNIAVDSYQIPEVPPQPFKDIERWQVKAKDLGKQTLYLSLNALLSVNGEHTTKSVKTFQREIYVQVTSVKGAWALVERYWVYLTVVFTAVVIPIVAYFLKKLFRADEAKPS